MCNVHRQAGRGRPVYAAATSVNAECENDNAPRRDKARNPLAQHFDKSLFVDFQSQHLKKTHTPNRMLDILMAQYGELLAGYVFGIRTKTHM
ncbi:hypothetical protein EVAR_27183_1 [Eumeta japonica]|uniref:Uncharacterized protein n=1 Tax=Eumeta variegata TaxID=151549 RepID=A0A4C1W1H4_EUMVA|nr:hypothetical protein EVAR_27183_1 [Eumeta japonica]